MPSIKPVAARRQTAAIICFLLIVISAGALPGITNLPPWLEQSLDIPPVASYTNYNFQYQSDVTYPAARPLFFAPLSEQPQTTNPPGTQIITVTMPMLNSSSMSGPWTTQAVMSVSFTNVTGTNFFRPGQITITRVIE